MFENMGVAVIGCTFVLGALVIFKSKRSKKSTEKKNENYWSREDHANTVRRKDITFLPYLKIPMDELPMDSSDDEEITEYQDTVRILSEKRILNLTGYSNTDLKEAYGIANLPLLSEYDENYTTLVNTLTRWGARLFALDRPDEAIKVLEYGIRIGTDSSRNYYMLADEYRRRGETERIDGLMEAAQDIDTLMKDSILKKLKEIRDGAILPEKND